VTSCRRLDGRVAIVTGAARGIGQAHACRLAEEGASVVVADVLDGSSTVGLVEERGASALALSVDVSSDAAVRAMVDDTLERFGRVDVLINNAAKMADLVQDTPFEDIDEAEWNAVMAVNVRGAWLCCRAVVPAMRAQGAGRIINTTSVTFFLGTPMFLHYACSKGAVLALTRSLASELAGTGITVNAIAPGLTFHPAMDGILGSRKEELRDMYLEGQAVKRSQVPGDLVGAMAFLASDDAAFMSGQTLLVDGGFHYH
jgi:NAD(P)-dependent dehydrogenase (short-subunit alcohol dehydrogenase family)